MGRKAKDLTNQKFGMLTAIKRVGDKISSSGEHYTMWLCKCDCGNEKVVARSALIKGETRSCGCIKGENHGMSNSKIYDVWIDMKKRCYDPQRDDYKNYGGRGIEICHEWKNSFTTFYNWALTSGYDDTLTIERINVNGNYEPSNCTWATRKEQANNKRNNHFLTFDDKTQTVAQWSNELGINENTIFNRINQGLTDEEVLTITKGCGSKRGKTYQGKTMTLRQWSEYTGIPYRILCRRIWEQHWDLEKALTTPVKKQGA